MKVRHKNEIVDQVCLVEFHEYNNGQTAIQLIMDDENREPWAVATVAVDSVPAGCVAIKDYSENEGMVDALVEAGIIDKEQVTSVSSGFVTIPVHKLLIKSV